LAESKNLSVIVTLFDFAHMRKLDINSPTRKIVFHIQESQSNFGLGFKKPNLDFENRDKDNVLNWLNHMVSS
jgi:hypothetical protein